MQNLLPLLPASLIQLFHINKDTETGTIIFLHNYTLAV